MSKFTSVCTAAILSLGTLYNANAASTKSKFYTPPHMQQYKKSLAHRFTESENACGVSLTVTLYSHKRDHRKSLVVFHDRKGVYAYTLLNKGTGTVKEKRIDLIDTDRNGTLDKRVKGAKGIVCPPKVKGK